MPLMQPYLSFLFAPDFPRAVPVGKLGKISALINLGLEEIWRTKIGLLLMQVFFKNHTCFLKTTVLIEFSRINVGKFGA